jgi:HAD superfamily hydrolase (TIGR01509 family)
VTSERPSGVEAVVFDLDGVIVDSEIWWDEARRDFAAARGKTWTEEDRVAVMGANSRQWSHTMRRRLGVDDPEDQIERTIVDAVVSRYRQEGAPRIDGAVEAVHRIASHWPLAVASSAHPEVIDAALGATGLDGVFSVVVSSDEVERGKPEPDVYLEAARRLGIAPERCLVVEDSYNGVRAGRAAGMTVVLVPNATIPPAPGTRELASAVIDRLDDLDPSRFELAPSGGDG